MHKDIYIIDGLRTPFLKSRNRPGPFSASDMATAAGKVRPPSTPYFPARALAPLPITLAPAGGGGSPLPLRRAAPLTAPPIPSPTPNWC